MKRLLLFVLISVVAISILIAASDITDYIRDKDYQKIAEFGLDKSFIPRYSSYEHTPVSYAVLSGWTEEELLKLYEIGLDVDTSFEIYGQKYTILKYALMKDWSIESLKELIELGVDPNATVNIYGNEYNIAKYFFNYSNDVINDIIKLIDAGVMDPNATFTQYSHEGSILENAVLFSTWNVDDIIKLIDAGADPYRTFSWYGREVNILQYLLIFGDWGMDDIVKLIESGVDPNVTISQYGSEMTILDYIIAYEDWTEDDIIKLVNAGATASKTINYYYSQYDIENLAIEKGYSADLVEILKASTGSSSEKVKENNKSTYPDVSIDANKLVDATLDMVFGKNTDSEKKQQAKYDFPSWMIGSWTAVDNNEELEISEDGICLVSYGVKIDLIEYCNSMLSIYGDSIPMEIKVNSSFNSCSIVLYSSYGISVSIIVFSKSLIGNKMTMTMDANEFTFTKK